MKHDKLLILALPFLMILTMASGASPSRAQDADAVSEALTLSRGEQFVPGEIIVKLRPDAEMSLEMTTAAAVGGQLDSVVRETSGGELVFRIDTDLATALAEGDLRDRTMAMVEVMRDRPGVEYAEPNYILFPVDTTPNDSRYDEQWHYFNNGTGADESRGGIGLPQAWDLTTGDPSVVVAVIDTGILPNHPDISGSANLLPGFDMITFFGGPGQPLDIANDGDGRDADPTDPGDAVAAGECPFSPPNPAQPNSWHGTHVAGTIGVGNTNNGVGLAGINWEVGLFSVRVLGKCGGTTTDITDGIRWAAGLPVPGVPNNAHPADVINMSLGGSGACSATYQSAIDDAVSAGVTVVVAAGNDAQNAAGFRPASCNDVITVAAGDARGRLVTRYSNFGATVEIMAPGGDRARSDSGNPNDGVLSMVDPSSGTYARYNGTSMAAPHVAGVAALMLACEPTLTPAQILSTLQATARPRSGTECPQACGSGLLDAAAALAATCAPVTNTLVLTPASADVRIGNVTTFTATTLPGVTVNFSSADAGIATVSPASGVTNAAGQATVTVTGVAAGPTTITAASGSLTDTSNLRVNANPGLSFWGLLALALGAFWLFFRRRSERVA